MTLHKLAGALLFALCLGGCGKKEPSCADVAEHVWAVEAKDEIPTNTRSDEVKIAELKRRITAGCEVKAHLKDKFCVMSATSKDELLACTQGGEGAHDGN